jgi:Holliday junction resolvase-like predicted endonuclease
VYNRIGAIAEREARTLLQTVGYTVVRSAASREIDLIAIKDVKVIGYEVKAVHGDVLYLRSSAALMAQRAELLRLASAMPIYYAVRFGVGANIVWRQWLIDPGKHASNPTILRVCSGEPFPESSTPVETEGGGGIKESYRRSGEGPLWTGADSVPTMRDIACLALSHALLSKLSRKIDELSKEEKEAMDELRKVDMKKEEKEAMEDVAVG